MNGLGVALFFAFCRLISSSQDDQLSREKEPLPLYIYDVEVTRLPNITVVLGNVSCPKSQYYGIIVAAQLYTIDDAEQFEFFSYTKCDQLLIDAANYSIVNLEISNENLTFYPTDQVLYVDYSVIYAWLAETEVSGFIDSEYQDSFEFDYPGPTSRPHRKIYYPPPTFAKFECEKEPEFYRAITFPAVFIRNKRRGVTVTFDNFTSPYLQADFLNTPRYSIDVTLYLSSQQEPSKDFLSIFHAVQSGSYDEDTPQLFLWQNQLVIQVVDENDVTKILSYHSGLYLKVDMAHRILLSITQYAYRLVVASWNPLKSDDPESEIIENWFDIRCRMHAIDWSKAYLVFGASDFFGTFTGFIDRATIYRTQYWNDFPTQPTKLSFLGTNLVARLRHCETMKMLSQTSLNRLPFIDSPGLKSPKNYSYETLISKLELAHSVTDFGMLDQSACLGSSSSEFALGVLTKWGFFNETNEDFLINYLKAALDGEHFADLSLGNYLLRQNSSLAVAYHYLKAAADFAQEISQEHLSSDRWIDSIHLDDQEELGIHQENEDGPLIAWLLYQGGMGDFQALHNVGQLFYLGAQGLDRDMERAAELFRQAAEAEPDPQHLYDYAIVLLHGRGVEKNQTEALKYLERAAAAGYGPAHGAIGWYWMENGNRTLAVTHLEKASNSVPEAAHNIGYLLLNDLHPNTPGRHPGLAYGYFLKAASLGSLEGALMVSHFLSQGIPVIDLRPDLYEACRFASHVALETPRLGKPLKVALSSYLAGDIRKSFLHYIIASETGHDISIFNAAYLCEVEANSLLSSGILSSNFHVENCTRSMYTKAASPLFLERTSAPKHALIWLANDFASKGEFKESALLYTDALLSGGDEGYYGLAWLAFSHRIRFPVEVFRRLVVSGDERAIKELSSLSPVDFAFFLLEACMTVEEKPEGDEFDEEGFLSLDGTLKSLPEGYWSCALYKFYMKANLSVSAVIEEYEKLDIYEVLNGTGFTKLLHSISDVWQTWKHSNVTVLFIAAFVIFVVGIYPIMSFLFHRLVRLINALFRS